MEEKVRIDKWLWAVRIFKTRSLAAEECGKGHVTIGDVHVKASRELKGGEIVKVRIPPIERHYRVKALTAKRMSAQLAVDFVEEVTPPENLALLNAVKVYGFESRPRGLRLVTYKLKPDRIVLIAREKKKNNIAEYILYMWQLEDMLRALKLDMEQVDRYLVAGFQADERTSKEIHDWYDNLIAIMQKEKVEEKGHIQALKNTVDELTELHFFLLHQAHDGRYRQLVTQAAGNLVEFRRKAGVDDTVSDVELALNGLYGQLMLKLQKREIHPETVAAMESFSKMIAYLAARYKQMEEEAENSKF